MTEPWPGGLRNEPAALWLYPDAPIMAEWTDTRSASTCCFFNRYFWMAMRASARSHNPVHIQPPAREDSTRALIRVASCSELKGYMSVWNMILQYIQSGSMTIIAGLVFGHFSATYTNLELADYWVYDKIPWVFLSKSLSFLSKSLSFLFLLLMVHKNTLEHYVFKKTGILKQEKLT